MSEDSTIVFMFTKGQVVCQWDCRTYLIGPAPRTIAGVGTVQTTHKIDCGYAIVRWQELPGLPIQLINIPNERSETRARHCAEVIELYPAVTSAKQAVT